MGWSRFCIYAHISGIQATHGFGFSGFGIHQSSLKLVVEGTFEGDLFGEALPFHLLVGNIDEFLGELLLVLSGGSDALEDGFPAGLQADEFLGQGLASRIEAATGTNAIATGNGSGDAITADHFSISLN